MSENAPALGRRHGRRDRILIDRVPGAQSLLTFVAVVATWEAGVDLLRIPDYLLPAPSAILEAAITSRASLLVNAAYTSESVIVGYAFAVVTGVLIALPIAFSPLMQRTAYPVLVFSQLVPKVALAPIFVIWFGFSLLPKIMITFLLSFFPVVINSIVGLRSLDPDIIRLTRSTGASSVDTFVKVRLPYALPTMFAGFKLAAISATVGAVIGEFIGSDRGLGYVILTANGDLHTELAFAAIAILTLIGLALYYFVEALERLLIPWHISQRGEGRGNLESS